MEKLSTEQFVSKINTIGKNLVEKFMQNSLPLNVKEYGDHFVVKYEEVKKQKVSVEKTFNELMVEKFDCELTNFTYSDKEPVQFFIRIFPVLFCNKAIDNDFEVTIGFKIKFLSKPRPNDFVEAWDSCKNLISVLVRNYGFESIPRTQITEYTMEIYKPIYTKKLFESFGTDAQKKYIDKQKEEKRLLSAIFSKKYNFNSEKESKTPKTEIKNGKPSESKNMNFGNYQTTEEDFWGFDSTPKKLNVGDSVKINGRIGIVEDYDDEYYYVKDDNTNIVKIFKDDAPKDYTSIQNMTSRLKTIVRETSTFQNDKNFGAVEFKKLLEANGFEVEYVENKSGTWQKNDYNEYFKNYDIKLTDGQHIYFRVIADDNFDTKEIICYLNGNNW